MKRDSAKGGLDTKNCREKSQEWDLFVSIYESLGKGVRLESDPHDGYRYRGRFICRVLFRNGAEEEHFAILLNKPIAIAFRKDCRRTQVILTSARYVGDSLIELGEKREMITSFSYLPVIERLSSCSSTVLELKKSEFSKDDFVWIGIGDVSLDRPRHPYVEPPWEMIGDQDERVPEKGPQKRP